MSDIIKAYRHGAKSPRPFSWRSFAFGVILVLILLGVFHTLNAQTVVISNRNDTPETFILYITRSGTSEIETHLSIQARDTLSVLIPNDATALRVDKEGDSWGSTGGIAAPQAGQVQYVYIQGSITYVFNEDPLTGGLPSAGGSSPSDDPVFMGFLIGAFALWLIVVGLNFIRK